MEPQISLDRDQIASFCRRNHIRKLSLFGSVLTVILLMQMVTGVFLAMYYSPSSSDAWGARGRPGR